MQWMPPWPSSSNVLRLALFENLLTPLNVTMSSPKSIPAPRALLFFLSHQDSYRRPLFSPQEVFCGPDTDTRRTDAGPTSIKVPVGSFDVGDVLRELPGDKPPELLVVKADATGRIFPRNLGQLSCPKVLLVGDTHHMQQPIRTVLRYAQEEPFDYVIFDHTRHHARLFAEAGVKNVHWLPAVDYGFVPRDIRKRHSKPLTFVGQAGRHHPYRCWVLEQLQAAKLPLEILRGTLAQTADVYADSLITLNISLNGDLNLRVFEALAAGGFLLTDALPEDSGLPQLFKSGEHLETWRSPAELVEKIRYYLDHPLEAQRIREAGHRELLARHHPDVKLRQFYDLVFDGKVAPEYDLTVDPKFSHRVTVPQGVIAEVEVHEALQELHRKSSRVTILTDDTAACAEWVNLPRVQVHEIGRDLPTFDAGALPHSLVLAWQSSEVGMLPQHLASFTGAFVVARAAGEALRGVLAEWGFEPVSDGAILFALRHRGMWLRKAWTMAAPESLLPHFPAWLQQAREADECLAIAGCADAAALPDLQAQALDRAVSLDRGTVEALLGLAANALDQQATSSTSVLLEEAARLVPLPDEVTQLRESLYQQTSSDPALAAYFRTIGRTPPVAALEPKKILLVTNLFPPQELGGYGRMMWEFANGLLARGHQVRVLTADVPEVAKAPTPDEAAMETHVMRKLQLLGKWVGGRPQEITDKSEFSLRLRDNNARVLTAARKFQADLVLVGNLDFISVAPVYTLLDAGFLVLHAVANAAPGYSVAEQPLSPNYWAAPCSNWNGDALRTAGFAPARIETLYPGARVDRFFRFFLPDVARLRICYASLVLPYKGAHVLIQALTILHRAGIDFSAEIAGDAPDAAFLKQLQDTVVAQGMESKVRFTGFLDRVGLANLFNRSNVLVFPSQFPEPFGISQVEAMAAGLVVVSSGTGGAKEIVRHDVDGLLFQPENAQDLADKLYSLTTQTGLMERLQKKAQSRAVEFSVDNAVRKIEDMIHQMKNPPELELPPLFAAE